MAKSSITPPPDQESPSLEERIKRAAENAVIGFIGSSGWLQPDYNNRTTVPAGLTQAAWNLVDQQAIIQQLKKRIEVELADRLMNHLAAEMATDIKQILGVPERRESIRAIARQHLESIMKLGLST